MPQGAHGGDVLETALSYLVAWVPVLDLEHFFIAFEKGPELRERAPCMGGGGVVS
ncbi:hypothetical protein [Citrobacter amalonaticus]|uniref:hypothetical protein n=1 Tax=Citrobacter amalonaticus TaxID=35703 RepID=UPI0015C519A1|nr:hypothetical protein [Citrobacter amalonaticus]